MSSLQKTVSFRLLRLSQDLDFIGATKSRTDSDREIIASIRDQLLRVASEQASKLSRSGGVQSKIVRNPDPI